MEIPNELFMSQGQTESSIDRRDRFSRKVLAGLGFLMLALAAFSPIGCGKKPTQAKVPVAPPISAPATSESKPSAGTERTLPPPAAAWTQLGIASWYVAEPAGRKTASGEPYERTALTAAHCTLPLNTLVRITNLSTHSEAIVRINDRGPFMAGRIIDLSVAAAKAVDVWRAGIAKVKLEVVESPRPIETGGRWCVQIGAFRKRIDALGMKETVTERYRPSRVLEFAGATGYWVQVRVKDDDRHRAQELASKLRVEEGGVFLVRLD
jgi:rare lipoprotein A